MKTESVYEKSLRLMDEHLNSVSDEEFLAAYNECEQHIGPLAIDMIEQIEA